MKTVYTDTLGLFVWAMLFGAAVWFWRAYESFVQSDSLSLVLYLAAGSAFLFLAVKRVLQIRRAKLEGTDPSILRVKSHD